VKRECSGSRSSVYVYVNVRAFVQGTCMLDGGERLG